MRVGYTAGGNGVWCGHVHRDARGAVLCASFRQAVYSVDHHGTPVEFLSAPTASIARALAHAGLDGDVMLERARTIAQMVDEPSEALWRHDVQCALAKHVGQDDLGKLTVRLLALRNAILGMR